MQNERDSGTAGVLPGLDTLPDSGRQVDYPKGFLTV